MGFSVHIIDRHKNKVNENIRKRFPCKSIFNPLIFNAFSQWKAFRFGFFQ